MAALLDVEINGVPLTLETSGKLFSPLRVDRGTLAMLSAVEFSAGDRVLDLGCGYGVAGIYAALRVGAENVVMSDIDPRAVALARQNAERNGAGGVKIIESDGFRAMDETGFNWILCNPPYHADFSVPKHFIEKGFNRLVIGGRMVMVTKRKLWYKNKLTALFGGVRVAEDEGYFVFTAEKRTKNYHGK